MKKLNLFRCTLCSPFVAIAIMVFLLDQWTKLWVSKTLSLGSSIPVIQGLFNITLVHNTGTAFGLLQQKKVFLIGVTLLSIGLLIYFYIRVRNSRRLWTVSLGLVLGGALGNLVDRWMRGSVIDFLDFYIGPCHWYTFNIADSAITVGVALLTLCFLKDRNEINSV